MRRDDGQDLCGRVWSPVLVTHRDPDFDAMVSCYLVRALVEQGELPDFAIALVGYSAAVDQGRYQVDMTRPESATFAVHMAYLAIQNLPAPAGVDANTWCLQRGFELLDATLAAMRVAASGPWWRLAAGDFHPPGRGVAGWREDPRFRDAADLLDQDFGLYQQDRAEAEILTDVELPTREGPATVRVQAFVAPRPTRSRLNKYWVRAAGFPYFVCPYASRAPVDPSLQGAPDELPSHYPRVILSLDPNWSEPITGRRPTLLGLGFNLEQRECERRRSEPGGDLRLRQPRYDDKTVDNDDPWYDGRGHDHKIVDAPRSGTHLPYKDVRAAATDRFWHVPLDHAELHLLLPATEPMPLEADRPKAFQAAGRSLQAWFDDCREAKVDSPVTFHGRPLEFDGKRLELPRGFTVVEQTLRTFPDGLAPAVRIVRLQARTGSGATLNDLVAWAQSLDKATRNTSYLLAEVGVRKGPVSRIRIDAMLRDLCLGSVETFNPAENDIVLFNRRAIAVEPAEPQASAQKERTAALLELLIYATFQAEALTRFSDEAATAVERGGKRVVGGRLLRSKFLVFQARYFHAEVVRDDAVRAIFLGLRDALGLDRLHDKVSDELDRLEQLERDEADENMNRLLFVVGLTGIVEAVFASWSDATGWHFAGLGVLMAAALIWYRRLSRRTGEAGGATAR